MVPLGLDLIWLAVPVILLAGVVHGTFGIGFPMVATPLLALFTDVFTAVLITLLPTMAVNLCMIWRGGVAELSRVKSHWLILPFSLLGTLVGAGLLVWLDPRPFLLLLAVAIVLYLNQERFVRLDLGWIHRHPKRAYLLFGLAAGIMAGTVNVMLPVLVILFMELRIAQQTMVVLFNINFFIGKLTQSLFFSQLGIDGVDTLLLTTLWLVPVAVVALMVGLFLSRFISAGRYLKILRALLWLMSGVLIARFLHAYLVAA